MHCRPGCRLLILAVTLVLVAGACADEKESTATSSTTAAPTTAATTTTTSESTTTSVPTTTTAAATTTTTAPELEPFGGVLTVGLPMKSTTVDNPWRAFEEGGDADWIPIRWSAYHPGLYSLSTPDYLLVPELAAGPAPPLVQDGNRWTATIPLREGFVWSDGEEVTAHDYVFVRRVVDDLGLSAGGPWLWWFTPIKEWDDPDTPGDEEVRWIESVEALDDHTIRFTFAPSEEPPGRAVYETFVLFQSWAFFLPEHFWAPIVERCRDEEDPAECLYAADGLDAPSSGPFVIESWEPGVGTTLVANPYWYYRGVTYTVYATGVFTQTGGAHGLDETYFGDPAGSVLSRSTGGPFIEEVRFIEYDSPEAAIEAFIRGDIDFADYWRGIPQEYRQRIEELPDVQIAVNPTARFRYLAFNHRKPPMNDLAFRQALGYVIDRETMIASVPQGSGIPRYSLIPPQLPVWYTDDITTWGRGMTEPERLEAAVGVLADAGYTWTTPPQAMRDANGTYTGEIIAGEGLTQPDGTPMPTIELLTPGPSDEPVRQVQGEWIARFAASLGITVDWQVVGFDTIVDLIGWYATPPDEGLGWDMHTMGWTIDPWDMFMPCNMHRDFFTADQDVVAGGGGENVVGYDNPEFEALSDAFDAATTLEEARGICAAMERHVAENLPYIVLWTPPIVDAWRSRIELPFTQVLGGADMAGMFDLVKVRD